MVDGSEPMQLQVENKMASIWSGSYEKNFKNQIVSHKILYKNDY